VRTRRDDFRFLIAPPIVIGSDESAIAVMHRALDKEENRKGIASPRISLRLATGFEDGPQLR
jgi:hypothetical protein